ncbi:MAG: hypothetical protein ACLRWQ_13870 [Flavonifractor plautii]
MAGYTWKASSRLMAQDAAGPAYWQESLCFAGLFGAVMYGAYDHMSGRPQVMVILGCRVMPGGEPLHSAPGPAGHGAGLPGGPPGHNGGGLRRPGTQRTHHRGAGAWRTIWMEHGVERGPACCWRMQSQQHQSRICVYSRELLEEQGAGRSAGRECWWCPTAST